MLLKFNFSKIYSCFLVCNMMTKFPTKINFKHFTFKCKNQQNSHTKHQKYFMAIIQSMFPRLASSYKKTGWFHWSKVSKSLLLAASTFQLGRRCFSFVLPMPSPYHWNSHVKWMMNAISFVNSTRQQQSVYNKYAMHNTLKNIHTLFFLSFQ